MEKDLTLSEALKGTPSESFVKMVKLELQEIKQKFFSIGFRLYEAQAFKYYESLGYETIEDLAEAEFGFKRSTTYGLISVYKRFCVTDKNGIKHNYLDDKYKAYSYSQLLEMQKLDSKLIDQVPATASVRNISEYRSFVNNNPDRVYSFNEWKDLALHTPDRVQKKVDLSKMTEIVEQPIPTFQEESKYKFDTRTSVRAFLNDYCNWRLDYTSYGFKQYRYCLKNGVDVWAIEMKTHPKEDDVSFIRKIVFYYLDFKDKEGPVKISKKFFETFCAKNHANL